MNENANLDEKIIDKINELLAKEAEDEADLGSKPSDTRKSRYKLYDIEKSESVLNEEVLLINGIEIKLKLPEERELIQNCLSTGKIENFELLKRILDNTGLQLFPVSAANLFGSGPADGGSAQPVVTTNLCVKQVDVLEENIRIKRVNKSGNVVEVNDNHVTTNSDERFIERVDVFERVGGKRLQPVRNVRRPPHNPEDDEDEDEIRMKIFQNIIDEDSGIQDEYLLHGQLMGVTPFVNSNSLEDFYSTDLSTNASSINSSRDFLKTTQQMTPEITSPKSRGGVTGSAFCATRRDESINRAELDSKYIFYRDGVLVSAHLDTLIRHLIPTDAYQPDSNYIFTFLLCSRLFISPTNLFDRLRQEISLMPDPYSMSRKIESLFFDWVHKCPYDFVQEELKKKLEEFLKKSNFLDAQFRNSLLLALNEKLFRLRLYENYLSLLTQIIATNQSVLVDEERKRGTLISSSGSNSSSSATEDPLNSTKSMRLEAFVNEKEFKSNALNDDQKYECFLLNGLYANNTNKRNAHIVNELKLSVSNYQFNLHEMCPQPQLVARQLTHIELERLSFIGPEEFVQRFIEQQQQQLDEAVSQDLLKNLHLNAPKAAAPVASTSAASNHADEATRSKGNTTKNLENYVQWFNRLTYLVATDIVKNPKKKFRVRSIDFWIEVAHECFNIGNFNSLMAITTGLNLSSISRLKKTWSKVQLNAKFTILEHQMDPSSNFSSYRSTLKAAMWRSAGARTQDDGQSRIIIPFFSLLVKDLYFLNEGCSNRLSNGHVNFEKLWNLSRQISDFIEWQRVQIPFERNTSIIFYLETRPILETENRIALASYECETPENNAEKDRFKFLKRN